MYSDFTGTRLGAIGAAYLLAVLGVGCGGRLDTLSEPPAEEAREAPARARDDEKGSCAQLAPPACEGVLRFADPRVQSWVRDAVGKTRDATLRYEDVCSLHDLRMSSGDFTIVSLDGIECLDHLRALEFDKIATPDLSPLGKLVELTALRLPNVVETSELSALTPLTELRTLSLGSVNGEALGTLAALPQLRELTLHDSEIDDLEGLSPLHDLAHLRLENVAARDLAPILDVFAPGAILELGGKALDCNSQRGNLELLTARQVNVRPPDLCP